jgi:hypothetical protein
MSLTQKEGGGKMDIRMDTSTEGYLDPGRSDEAEEFQTIRKARPASRGTAFYQRKRAVKACQVCRARRTKCDNLKPSCSFCLKVGATCIQSPTDLSSFDPASLKILERLDSLESLVKSLSLHGDGDDASSLRKTRVVQVPSPDLKVESRNPVDLGMVLPPVPDQLLTWGVFRDLRENEFAAAEALQHLYTVAASPPKRSILDAFEEPRRIKELLDNFFAFVHVKNPILDENATRQMVHATVVNGIDWTSESCLTLLICALGSIATPFGSSHATMPGTTAYSDAQEFFYAAQRRLGVLFASDDIIAAQCLFLAGVFMMCVFQPVKAWRYFVQALGGCQQLPFLTQAPPSPDNSTTDEILHTRHYPINTLHQAIYWSTWKSEREMRADLRLPDFTIDRRGLGIYPPFFPTPPSGSADMPSDPSQQAPGQISWYFYLAEISLRRLVARVTAEIVKFHESSNSSYAFLQVMVEALPSYEALLNEWVASLPHFLSFQTPTEEDDVCRFVLRGHALNLYEMVYWPFISTYIDNSAHDLHLCIAEFKDVVQKGLDHHLLRLTVNKPGYRHRHHGTHPMMRSCSRSALVLLAAYATKVRSKFSQASSTVSMPQGWQEAVRDVVDTLDYWKSETRDFVAIQHVLKKGLTNISSFSSL